MLGSPHAGLKMEIVFKRRLTNELLTTYLPSFLLLLISYATTFFKPFYFEAAVTVNLTVMLVTTTLFVRWGWGVSSFFVLPNCFLFISCSIVHIKCRLPSQCDGEASGHFLRSSGRHLAHIWTTHPLLGGTTTSLIYNFLKISLTYFNFFIFLGCSLHNC